jgi:uncharacterized repeat protein (TIGR04042 family)
MPEMTVTVRWPDGRVEEHYSPSMIMRDHLQPGITYTIEDFAWRAQAALAEASQRVRAKYGFYCMGATESAHRIRELAAAYPSGATVEVLAMQLPLPGASGVPSATSASTPSLQPQEPQ